MGGSSRPKSFFEIVRSFMHKRRKLIVNSVSTPILISRSDAPYEEITGAEDLQRVLQLLLIGTDGLQNPHIHQRHGNIHPGGPWTKRETVEQNTTAVTVDELIV